MGAAWGKLSGEHFCLVQVVLSKENGVFPETKGVSVIAGISQQ